MRHHTGNRIFALMAIAAGAIAQAGEGVEVEWTCEDGGTFADLCWEGFAVPGETDSAVFDIGGGYTVTFDSGQLTDRLLVRSGLVTFDLAGQSYGLLNSMFNQPSIVIGDAEPGNPRLKVTGGALDGEFIAVGREAPAFGVLELEAGAFVNGGMQCSIGHLGMGVLELPGGMLTSEVGVIGLGGASAGLATIDGVNASWQCQGDLTVAQGGLALMDVEAGATVTSGDVVLAGQLGSWAEVAMRSSSTWFASGSVDVGFDGHGTLTIEGGSVMMAGGFATVGFGIQGNVMEPEWGVGTVEVRGSGSSWIVGGDGGDLHLGPGEATVVVEPGAEIAVGGDLLVLEAFFADTLKQIVVGLEASGDFANPAIFVAGMTDPLTIRLELLDGFVPEPGDEFFLIEAGLSLGAVTLDAPELPEPLFWVLDQAATTAVARVAEPVPGDATGDGQVTVADLIQVIIDWGACPDPPDPCPSDLDGDGQVGVGDLTEVILNWTG